MRKFWKVFWLILVVLIGGVWAFGYQYGNRAEWVKMNDLMTPDFVMVMNDLLTSKLGLPENSAACSARVTTHDSIGALADQYCDSRRADYFSRPAHLSRPCVLLRFTHDVASCPDIMSSVFAVFQ